MLARLAPILVLLTVLSGCGESVDAPKADLPTETCPTLDEALPNTLDAVRDGRAAPLAAVIEAADTPENDTVAVLLRVVLRLLTGADFGGLGELDLSGALDPEALSSLESALAAILQGFTASPADSPEAADRLLVFGAVAEMARTCPEGSLTALLRRVLRDDPLLCALEPVVRDPRFTAFFAPLLDPASGDGGRRGVVVLIVNLFDLIARDPFDFDAIAGLLSLIIPAEEDPMAPFLVELERALSGDGLTEVQTAIACINAVERTNSQMRTLDGADMIGDALYDVLAAFGPDPSALIDAFGPGAGALIGLVDGLLATLQSDPVLRADLLTILDFLLAPENARGLLEGAAALLEAGALQEIAALAEVFLDGECREAVGATP